MNKIDVLKQLLKHAAHRAQGRPMLGIGGTGRGQPNPRVRASAINPFGVGASMGTRTQALPRGGYKFSAAPAPTAGAAPKPNLQGLGQTAKTIGRGFGKMLQPLAAGARSMVNAPLKPFGVQLKGTGAAVTQQAIQRPQAAPKVAPKNSPAPTAAPAAPAAPPEVRRAPVTMAERATMNPQQVQQAHLAWTRSPEYAQQLARNYTMNNTAVPPEVQQRVSAATAALNKSPTPAQAATAASPTMATTAAIEAPAATPPVAGKPG